LAPNAKLRKVVIESAGPAASTQMLLDKAREKTALDETEGGDGQPSLIRKASARCWALLCPRCEKPMRIIAFIQDPPTIEKILTHIGEATRAPEVVPARGPPQGELEFTQDVDAYDWPNMDQTTARAELLVEGDRGVLR
jgi:hypothetical protein